MAEILFIGDSILDWFDEDYYYPDLKIENHGIAGDTINGVINRVKQAVSHRELKKILVMIGHNDLCMGIDAQTALAKYKKILEIIKNENIKKVFISGLLPIDFVSDNIEMDFNNGLKNYSEQYRYRYIPVRNNFLNENKRVRTDLSDGLHLFKKGYDVLAEVFREYVYS